mmetsp:Transcript_60382/g.143931  ORF Transcript_60382/g.143931 Transcript_60382/m.143931 type:complete len:482 (-) Transcript_60382:350-1795(-)
MAASNGKTFKVLMVPGTLYAHCLPFEKLAEALVKQPKLSVSVAELPSGQGSNFPRGVQYIRIPGVQDGENSLFACNDEVTSALQKVASTATGWIDSIGRLVPLVPVEKMTQGMIRFLQWVQNDCDFDMIICEPVLNITNHLNPICRQKGITLVCLVCPSRPDPLMNPLNLIPLLFSPHVRALFQAISTIGKVKADLTKGIGVDPLPDSDIALQLLPGSRALLRGSIHERQLFTGSMRPFFASNAAASFSNSELHRWLASGGGLPTIYVSSGTLVDPNPDLVQRLAEGLNKPGEWRVLWSLPEADHKLLPANLPKDVIRVEKTVPQVEVLQSGLISCHLSHCGANSTHETMAAGVPMVCLPFYCDQYEWAASICQDVGAGVQLDNKTVTAAGISEAVKRVLATPTYAEKAKDASARMRSHVKALGKALEVNALEEGGAAVTATVLTKLLNGEKAEALFKDVKMATDKYATRGKATCLSAICG